MRRVVLGLLYLVAALVGGCALFDSGILYEETWSDTATTEWALGDSEYATKTIEGGRYHVLVKQATTMRYWNLAEGPFGDAQYDLDVMHEAGTNDLSAGGLLFKVSVSAGDKYSMYYFRVSAAGTFQIGKWVEDVWTILVDWTASDAIKQEGENNHLTVIADGASLTFLINGAEVAEIADSSLTTGLVGVGATGWSDDVDVEESFDNLVVRKL